MNKYEILKFIFPEYQIIEVVKDYGFFSGEQKYFKNKTAYNRIRNKVAGGDETEDTSDLSYSYQYNDGNSSYSKSSNKKYSNFDNDLNNDNLKKRTNQSPSQKKKEEIDRNKAFEIAEKNINNIFIGQKNSVECLSMAFKRPMISGVKADKPRNTIFVSGHENSGRSTLIDVAVKEFKKQSILNYNNIIELDLSLYNTPSNSDVFLADLYKALYNQSDVVVFKNYRQAHSGCIGVLSSLVSNGKYKMDGRYTFENGTLIEITGTLTIESFSEISANQKYFIFITEDNESKISEFWGSKFMESVRDVIKIEDYSEADITCIVNRKLIKVQQKCNSELGINIHEFVDGESFFSKKYNIKCGINGIGESIDKYIYSPLAEYKLRNGNNFLVDIDIIVSENTVIRGIRGKNKVEIELSEYMPKVFNNLEQVKEELNYVIGLNNVKQYILDLENDFNVQQMRENAGYKVAEISKHMIFTGNPGTGKTTIARIVAKYLKAIGVLSVGQLIEVTRSDLVGQYVGHTAKICNDVIKSALGGVLFIDEAYSLCRDKEDSFGLEAVDTLVKGMEDYRDDLVVILAGYKDEMEQFLKNNSGLVSRFPNKINFEDYTSDEMLKIAHITAKSKGYKIEESCDKLLNELFDKSQIKGRNDSGNGRLVRNIVERAILEQSKRLSLDKNCDMGLLTVNDFKLNEREVFDLEKELSKIVGLDNVKDFIRTQHKVLLANEKRKKADIKVDVSQTLNMVFTGNPGTGKTTVARLVAKMLKDMGLLKKGHLVETDRGGLVAKYSGHTTSKTTEIFQSALGGVLFIDEAYALASDGGGFGKEAIDTLVKLIEDFRGEIVVIIAGYEKEMSDFMGANSGLESRFPLKINFSDYSVDELTKIAYHMVDNKGFLLTDDSKLKLSELIIKENKSATAYSGNGRMVRNLVENIMRNQSARIAINEVEIKDLNTIQPCDIIPASEQKKFDLESALSKIIGLDEVKNYVRGLYARLRIQTERRNLGLTVDESQTLNMIFKGNPGTGKTMVARTIAELLFNIGIINSNKLIETDRAGLVAGYVGQTAIKTAEKIKEAFDGVLFIDEAYSLSQGGENDFGRESIDTLVKMMDDNRERLFVILAGYSDNMDNFIHMNPGLKSRFPNVIDFVDYNEKELISITEGIYNMKGYILSPESYDKLNVIFSNARKEDSFGNGRYARNVVEKSINKQALRLSTDTDLTKEELITIEACDIEGV